LKEFYDKYEAQIRALAIAPIVLIAFYFISREPKFSCDDYAKGFRDDYECHLILSHKSQSSITYFFGTDLYTHQSTDVKDGSKWISKNFDKFHKGDTIIKNKGEYTITIKRKGAVIDIPFECGRIYPDTVRQHQAKAN
jgi:hypothetical protein